MSGCKCAKVASRGPSEASRRAAGVRVARARNDAAALMNDAPCGECLTDAALSEPRPSAAFPASGRRLHETYTISAPDEASEREADGVADRIMSARAPAATGSMPIAPDTGAPKLQRLPAATPGPTQAPEAAQDVLSTPGRPLDARARAFFEPRFGRDFSSVRVHADDSADRSAGALNAQAYTVGHHIVFARGSYAPAAEGGRRLLAHELAHVVQQSYGAAPRVQRKEKKGPGSCGTLGIAAATVLGTQAHIQIQKVLLKRGIRDELEIPRATKTSVLSRRCQPRGTFSGFADVARVTGPLVALGEIKPFYSAKVRGRLEARHYRRRAEQSKQRLTRTGGCGRTAAWYDDNGFSFRVGGINLATTFTLISGVLNAKENFGPYVLDKRRDLIAEEVGSGAIGYWCKLNAAGKKEKEEEKKKKKEGKAGAGNVGLGVSVGGSSVGGANAGVGVSVDSNSASVGTAGAGIAISSDTAGAGVAGVGITKDTTGAAAGAVGAGVAKDSEGVAVGAAGAGTASGSTSAGAGVAGAGRSEDSITAGAGVAGTGEVKDSVAAAAGAKGSGKTEGVVGARTGSPKKPIDPKDVSGANADQQAPGHGDDEVVKSGAGEGGKAGGDKGASNKPEGSGSGQPGGRGGTSAKGKSTPNPLGVSTVVPLGTSDAEREKLAAEAVKVAQLLDKAKAQQLELLRYLAQSAPDGRYVVPASDWVQKVLNVTAGLTLEEIQYLKQLNWKPGNVTEEELRERVQKALANRKKAPASSGDSDDASKKKTSAEGGGEGGISGAGKGPGASTAGGQKAGKGSSDKGAQATSSTPALDRATTPPAGSDRSTAGFFRFKILSGMSPASNLKRSQAVDCKVRIEDLNKRTFELEGVSITFVSRVDKQVTIKGVKYTQTQFTLLFTRDFWSEKNKFYGRGGADSVTNYEFDPVRAK